jgi:hypothetical protein
MAAAVRGLEAAITATVEIILAVAIAEMAGAISAAEATATLAVMGRIRQRAWSWA